MEKIENTIGDLHNITRTVLRDSPDQRQRQEQINEVVLRRHKSYHAFVKTLSRMSEEERRITRFGEMPLLWQEIPARLDLEGHVGNADDPGDGKVYSEQDVQKARSVLKAFHDTWHEATIKANSANAMEPETLRRVIKLTYMARICLILRGMKQERLLDHICEHSKDDRHLPFERTMLERILGPEDAPHASTFVAEQYRAIRRTWNDGDHLEIPDGEPLPLEHISKYGDGSYATVTRTRHAFTGMYYARKEQPEGRKHLEREIERLTKLNRRQSRRHIVEFVKSYQRGNKYGILLKPAATTDLQKLLRRYERNRFDYSYNTERRRDRVTLKPIILTAFGCLSRGLAQVHGCNIHHNDIRPSNILYQKAFTNEPPRFLWADFGLAYDFNDDPRYSRTRGRFQNSPRYAAPEIMEEIEARRSRGNFDTDISDTDSDLLSPEPNNAQLSSIVHGWRSDIYSFGIVFLEILSHLNAEGSEHQDTVQGDFEACVPIWKNITATQKWAQIQVQKLESKDSKNPLILLFQLGSQMISHAPEARPSTTQIVSRLQEASPAYFCTPCQRELEQYNIQQYNIQQADAFMKEVRSDREAEQGSKYEEDQLEDSRDMQSNFRYNEAGTPVISRGSQYDYDGILPDAESGNNDDLTSLLSIQSFADSGYESLNNPGLQDEADELTSLLLDDYQLQKLFTIIFRRSKDQERFVSKFRMLLKVFGTELKREALDASHNAGAELARLRATYIASEIQRRYLMEKAIDEDSDGKRSAIVATSLMKHLEFPQPNLDSDATDQYDYASDSEASDDIEGAIDENTTTDQLPKVSLEKLKEFMICSQAFANLQNALRRMVYPNPLIAIDDQISNAHELCPGKVNAVFNIHLDINNYLSSELNYQTSLQERSDLLGSVLTISGTASSAFATTAANYMRWKWPQLNFGLLEAIESSAKARGSSKLT